MKLLRILALLPICSLCLATDTFVPGSSAPKVTPVGESVVWESVKGSYNGVEAHRLTATSPRGGKATVMERLMFVLAPTRFTRWDDANRFCTGLSSDGKWQLTEMAELILVGLTDIPLVKWETPQKNRYAYPFWGRYESPSRTQLELAGTSRFFAFEDGAGSEATIVDLAGFIAQGEAAAKEASDAATKQFIQGLIQKARLGVPAYCVAWEIKTP